MTLSRLTPPTLVIALVALIIFGAVGVSAQHLTGQLPGAVVDTTGGGILDAQASATNQDTGSVPNSQTDAQGSYIFATITTERPA